MLKFSNHKKILFWSFIGFFHFIVDGLEQKNKKGDMNSSLLDISSDNRLEVRTRFPRYRVYYNPSQTAQEVLDEKKANGIKKEQKKE